MRRRLTMFAASLLILVGSSLSLAPARATAAASIDDSGWWWRLQPNPDLLLPGPPNVEDGQLLVQGALDGATAVAAVAATLAPGEAEPVLTLTVAEGGDAGGDGAVLLACQAGSSWVGGHARAWPDKPKAACAEGGVAGARTADGSVWTFDLRALQFGQKVNVVLVPGVVEGQPDGANGSVFSLTFEAPLSDSIQTRAGSPPPPPTEPPTTAGTGGLAPPDTGSPVFESPPVDTGGFDLPPVEPALPEADQGLTPVAPSVQDRAPLLPTSADLDPRSEHARTVGVLILLLGGVAVYLSTRQQAVVGPDGVPGGLGRWSSPRMGSPPPLRG